MSPVPTFRIISSKLGVAPDSRMTRLFLGPIKNPTWKDFFIRVGGALALIVVVILVAQAFIPESQGIAVIVASAALIAFVAMQELRHHRRRKQTKQGGSRK